MSSDEWLRYAASGYQLLKDIERSTLSAEITGRYPGSPEEELVERWEEDEDLSCATELIRLLDARGQDARDMALMARLLAACYGCRRSAGDIAVAIADKLYRYDIEDAEKRQRLTKYALGWLAVASGVIEVYEFDDPVEQVAQAGDEVLARLARDAGAMASRQGRGLNLEGCTTSMAAAAIQGFANEEAKKFPDAPEEMIVIRGIAGSGKEKIGDDFDEINCKPLEMVRTPDLVPVRERLASEFPYAEEIVDTILGDLVGRKSVRLRPTLLVGAPGSGKSRLLRRITEELDLPSITYPCGGASDSSIAGTARRWSNTEPSLPMRQIRDREVANPALILDEIDKAAQGRGSNGGRLWDALLQWLEPETASRWLDPYVGTECDLSAVCWLATANDLREVPDPLLDRLRIIRMPTPRREDLPALASAMMTEISRDRGLDERWVEPLAEFEVSGLRKAWTPGSLRSLRRLVEGVLAAREMSMPRA